MAVLKLTDVKKRYAKLEALRGLNLGVEQGQVYGFLGRNGAGKSTAMRIVMGITSANSGDISLFDDAQSSQTTLRQRIGYVAQEQNFYGWMSAKRIGEFIAGFYPTWDDAEYGRLLANLEVPLERPIDGFSGGMRAKLGLALALAHRPALLLLDEPTAGMDAVARREFIDMVSDNAARTARTTVFSSHLIDEVERAADTVGIIDEGVMQYEGPLRDLRAATKRFVLTGESVANHALPGALLGERVRMLRDEIRGTRRELIVRFEGAIPSNLYAGQWKVEQPSLEDTFVAMVGKRAAL